MIDIKISEKPLVQHNTKCRAIIVEQDFDFDTVLKSLDARTAVPLRTIVEESHFSGKSLTAITAPIVEGDSVSYLLCIGIGKRDDKKLFSIETYRRVVGKIIRIAEQHKWHTVSLQLPPVAWFGVDDLYLAQQTAEIAKIAVYVFDKYISDYERKSHVKELCLAFDTHDKVALDHGVERGKQVAHAVNLARHWIDLPPVALHPEEMATIAREIAQENNLKITVFNEKQIIDMGMGGLAAVSRGSDIDAQFIVLEYDCGNKNAPTLGFVGKGITFDSGGLSLKPAESMETMKDDMSGAAAVLAALDVLSKQKAKVNVVGFMPLSENLPSGKATKPGDIVTFYNGKTAEIKNTDAEGRLILADALSYAEKHYKLDAIVDLATLTGACAYALGPYFSGLMSQNDELVDTLMHASQISGDALWRLPLNDDYRAAIKSSVADIANIGSKRYMAGAITAGLFLSNFVEKTPWAHIDIAGSAFNVPDLSYYRNEGATGVGVRLLVQLAMNWQ